MTRSDFTDWLLDAQTPSVRYLTLRRLLDLGAGAHGASVLARVAWPPEHPHSIRGVRCTPPLRAVKGPDPAGCS